MLNLEIIRTGRLSTKPRSCSRICRCVQNIAR